ncbi:hypothetical protein NBH00_16815 [Paraconexibacter antarcticus]|uniref:Zinc ribbon domain-containing protein n=1 Tax=Paraconexibacter antarcticus TaxID=2949664 RepID=A0ABY5DQN4_9ACTN|nr:hypothetical protein [Paraconexibacter antarcticus]UTI63015.1 hypothetical protein NBH00_16815 [Paraconexibacter antarcticus]
MTDTIEFLPSPLVPTAGDSCPNCAAKLAVDQRYCLRCGERRGRPRFTPPPAAATVVPSTETIRTERGPATTSTALIAGVATLVLAMGVGVLIGHSAGGDGSTQAAAPQVVTIAGGAAAPAATDATATTPGASDAAATASTPSAKKSTAKAAAAAKVPKTKPAAKKKPVPGKVVKVGQKGSGPGYTGGKFTGNFFGSP